MIRFDTLRAALAAFVLTMVMSSSALARDRSERLLEHQNVVITVDDLAYYIVHQVNPEVYERALAKPGAVKYSIGNLYILRRASQEAQAQALLDPSYLAYEARDAADRRAVDEFVEVRTQERLTDTDWEALAKEQYVADLDVYGAEEQVKVSHILVSRENRSFNELMARVLEVQGRLDQGDDFHELAVEMSDDSSVERNRGSLGLVKRGDTVQPFEDVAFAMNQEGDISEPVLTNFGVHFILFEGRFPGEPVRFEQVKDRIIDRLMKQRSQVSRGLVLEPFRDEIQDQLSEIDEATLARDLLDILINEVN